jgi:hypothetical protein
LLTYHLDGDVIGKLPINNSVSSDQSHITDPSEQTILFCLDMLGTVAEEAAVKFLDEFFVEKLIESQSHELDPRTRKRMDKIQRQYCYEAREALGNKPASQGSGHQILGIDRRNADQD